MHNWQGLIAALLIVWIPEAAAVAADRPITIDDRVATYRIEGATSRDLWNQMHALGPVDDNEGRRFAAKTHWNIAWHYWYRNDSQACHIDHSDVSITTVTILPQWTDMGRGTPALQAEWASFIEKLKTHEAGHRTNGMAAAVAVRKIIDQAAPTTDCRTLGNGIDTAAHAALARSNQADVDYDLSTRHGMTQGAVLP